VLTVAALVTINARKVRVSVIPCAVPCQCIAEPNKYSDTLCITPTSLYATGYERGISLLYKCNGTANRETIYRRQAPAVNEVHLPLSLFGLDYTLVGSHGSLRVTGRVVNRRDASADIMASALGEQAFLASVGDGASMRGGSTCNLAGRGGVVLRVVGVEGTCAGRELAGRQLEASEVETRELEEVVDDEDGLGKDVEDSVKVSLTIGRDDARAFTQSECY
jgi:hypothetical protein